MVCRLVLVLIACGAAQPPAPVALAWKLQAGDAFRVEFEAVQAMKLEAKNKPFQQTSTIALHTHWRVREVKDGVAAVTITVESMTSKSTTGDAKGEVVSKDDALWQGAAFEITVDAQGRIRDLRGYDDLLKKLAAGNPSKLKILRALKPPESFQTLLQDALGPLPEKPVSAPARWTQQTSEVVNLFGTFQHVTELTYAGVKDGLARIDTRTVTTFKNPRYAIENDVFRVLKGEISAEEGTGHFLFDAGKGRLVRGERTGKLRGTLTLEALGAVQRLQFESASRIAVRVK